MIFTKNKEEEALVQNFKDKLQVFNKFHFEEEPHIYWWLDENGNRRQAQTSMTALIHSHSQPFDAERLAPFTAKKLHMPVQDVLDMWKLENDLAKVKGTHIHAFNEYMWSNREYTYPKDKVIEQFGFDILEPLWPRLTKIAIDFYNMYKDRIIPIGLELVVGDEELEICGSIDFLCYSRKLKSLVIIDYKSNKEIKFKPYKGQKMTGCLSHLDDCNYIHYSLQLNGYQYILEKKTGLKLHNEHFLIWMNENNDTYEIYKTKDLYEEAKTMLLECKVDKSLDDECPF